MTTTARSPGRLWLAPALCAAAGTALLTGGTVAVYRAAVRTDELGEVGSSSAGQVATLAAGLVLLVAAVVLAVLHSSAQPDPDGSRRRRHSRAALACGVASVVTLPLFLGAWLLAVAAVVLGVLALRDGRRARGAGPPAGGGAAAVTGIAAGAVVLGASALLLAALLVQAPPD